MIMSTVLAFDLGASSGRALLGRLENNKIIIEEIHRFPNDPVQVAGRLQWDILRLYHEIKQGLLKAKHQGVKLESIGIDSWAVDFGLLGTHGELLANPYHYRDHHTDGVMDKLLQELPADEVFARTGIQFLPFNSIFQLYALKQAKHPALDVADQFLMIPDLLRYWMTGERYSEFSNASTTQLYNPIVGDWDEELLRRIDVPKSWFAEVVQPGTQVGALRESLCEELGIESVPVIAVAEHDTGSAVVAVPALERTFAYLSCGTWSLMGTEVDHPVINEEAQRLNFTNEGGAYGTYRLLKNIMGLWILQECRREWERAGSAYSFVELVKMAEEAPAFTAFIDPDDDRFLHAGDMPDRVRAYCAETGQAVPSAPGVLVRVILESLALRYRAVLEMTERLSGHTFSGLHMVGGGINNTLLCQWTANSIGKPVWAGPTEGSAIGNLAVQWIASGALTDIWEARRVIRDSFEVVSYEPAESDRWNEAYTRFNEIYHSRR
jgi:rhamnulokinase